MKRTALVGLVLSLACGGGGTPPAEADPNLPPPAFEGVPGWLAFVGPGDAPREAERAATIHDPEGAWVAVRRGTGFRLVDESTEKSATLADHRMVPLGCDDVERPMAFFASGDALFGTYAWVLPAEGQGARPLRIEPTRSTPAARDWSVEGLDVALETTGRHGGRLIVQAADARPLDETWERQLMEGAEDAPVDLSRDDEVGVPYPRGAWRFDDGTIVLAFETQTWEGHNTEVWKVEPRAAKLGELYVYLCAF